MHMNDAQRAVLSSAFHNGPGIWEYVPAESLDTPYRDVALAIQALHTRGTQVTVSSLETECLSRGFHANTTRWIMGPMTAEDAAAYHQSAFVDEKVESLIAKAHGMIGNGADRLMVADELVEELSSLPRPKGEIDPWATWEEVIQYAEIPVEWVIPGLLAHRERFVLTGMEGHGKSMLLGQLTVCAGYGVSPLDTAVKYPRQRVMVLDVENSHEGQLASMWRLIASRVSSFAEDPDTPPDILLSRRRTIDLMNPVERRAFLDEVDAAQPDLLLMGSGYKLADSSDYRDFAMAIQRTADEAKARTGCAVIIETHAGHGVANDRNNMRPDGSSYWLRWPEFGMGLSPVPDIPGRWARMVRWRGDRQTGRDWPAGWTASSVLPWQPVTADELEARGAGTHHDAGSVG